jgi:hypothetical protein
MQDVEVHGEMYRGDLTSMSAPFDPAGELSLLPRTWIGAFTMGHQRSEP